jgi:hypothetical protein
MTGQEFDLQEFEDQDWDLDDSAGQQEISHDFINGDEKRFLIQDPEPEVIMELVQPVGEDTDRSEVLFDFIRKTIIAPEITLERWRSMMTADKIALSNKVSDAVGVDKVLGFPDGIPEDELEDLLSE